MRTFMLLPLVSAISLMMGCTTTPENANLLQARQQFSALQHKPESSTLAALETKDAFTALSEADQLSNQDRKAHAVDQLAYLAIQKIALAEQTIAGRKVEAALQHIDAERTQVQLDVRTQQLKALQSMKAQKTERGEVITFGDVLFDTGKAELKYGNQRNFEQLAAFLVDNPERNVRVEGFTDNVGGDAFNQNLSERRANTVANVLRQMGVGSDRIVTSGYGERYPVTDNATAQARQLNRRVEVIISHGAAMVGTRNGL